MMASPRTPITARVMAVFADFLPVSICAMSVPHVPFDGELVVGEAGVLVGHVVGLRRRHLIEEHRGAQPEPELIDVPLRLGGALELELAGLLAELGDPD